MKFTQVFFFALFAICLHWALSEPSPLLVPSYTVEAGEIVEFDVEKGSKLLGFSLCRLEEERRYGTIEIGSDSGVHGYTVDCHGFYGSMRNFEFDVSGHVIAKVHNAGKMYFIVNRTDA